MSFTGHQGKGAPNKKRKIKDILTVFGLALAVFVGFMYYYQTEKDTVAAIIYLAWCIGAGVLIIVMIRKRDAPRRK